jgi:small subunit ribosomal protein S2
MEIEAKRAGALFVNERWLGGTITNYRIIKKNMNKLADFLKRRESGDFEKYTKKERLLLDREIAKLQASVGGIAALQGKPAALFIIDIKREKTAVREGLRYEVPIAALVDTNSDPTGIKYVIPGNDDAMRSIALIVKAVADAVEEGYKDWSKKVEAGEISTTPKLDADGEVIIEKVVAPTPEEIEKIETPPEPEAVSATEGLRGTKTVPENPEVPGVSAPKKAAKTTKVAKVEKSGAKRRVAPRTKKVVK